MGIDTPTPPAPFIVSTPQRQVTALGTRFAVRHDPGGTAVAVTQGRVRVSGFAGELDAGRQLLPGADAPAAIPRASHLLDWTRELVAAADSPLVPANDHAGGAIVARDPNGQDVRLQLRRYLVDVYIEDGFARTTIDQTYFNHTTWRMEGTFYFPLPPDASLSRLAMYVNGRLNEGGMVERDYGRSVYESIVRRMQDPALLEWIDGSTFKMRVFPLEARQEKRVLISYTQKLADLYGRMGYRFPAGHSLGQVGEWAFHARVRRGFGWGWRCDSHLLTSDAAGGDLLLDCKLKDYRFHADVAIDFTPSPSKGEGGPDLSGQGEGAPRAARLAAGPQGRGSARFSAFNHDGARYLMLRFRPELPGEPQAAPPRRDWLVLFESSADRDPLLARVQVEIVRGLLANAGSDDRFAVLTAGTHVSVFRPAGAEQDNPSPSQGEVPASAGGGGGNPNTLSSIPATPGTATASPPSSDRFGCGAPSFRNMSGRARPGATSRKSMAWTFRSFAS